MAKHQSQNWRGVVAPSTAVDLFENNLLVQLLPGGDNRTRARKCRGGGRGELPMGRHCRGDPHNQAVLARFREPHHSEGTSHCTPAVPASGSRCRGATRGGKGAAQDPHDLVGMGERESSGMVPPQCHAGQPRQERQPRFRFRRLLGPWFQSGLSHRQGHRALAPLPLLPLTSACSPCSPCAPLACSPCSLCVRR